MESLENKMEEKMPPIHNQLIYAGQCLSPSAKGYLKSNPEMALKLLLGN